jgi:hypothetical protein
MNKELVGSNSEYNLLKGTILASIAKQKPGKPIRTASSPAKFQSG